MLGLILGVFVILLGVKAFTPSGIPFTREKNLTGVTAKIIGGVCILLGVAFFVGGVLSTLSVLNILGGR